MSIVLTVLQIVAPVFILALIGYAWVKLGAEYRVQFVTRLAMTVSVPALIFTSLMKTDIDPASLKSIFMAAIVAYLVVAAVTYVLVLTAKLDIRTFLAPLIFGNTGNLGFPLALFAFGQAGLGYAVVIFAVMAVFSFTFGVWLVAGGGSIAKVIKEPMVGATILGGVFLSQGWQTPIWMTNTLDLVGQMAIPLMLITLGVSVARLQTRRFFQAVYLSLAKVCITISVAWLSGFLFALPPVAHAILVLQISTPVAVTSYLLAEKYDANADEVAGLVVISTLISIITIPLTLIFLL